MKIAIVDADIVGRNKHRFPNLACMKLSSYYKSQGHNVELVWDYKLLTFFGMPEYDKIFISKVFTDTPIDDWILGLPNVEYGGTGFFYDKAPPLPEEVEHSKPDYHLYDRWVDKCIENGANEKEFSYYRDYSIGFLTRGCFRQCEFCVNRNYKRCVTHSNIKEFYDESRPKLCFLDDNFFANPKWYDIIQEVKAIGKPFQFKQGLDERLLTDKHINELWNWKYDGEFIFAFDNIEDRPLIEKKLNRIFELYPDWKKGLKFYVFCGFDRNDKWDNDFWINDIETVFERAFILARYSALQYIMRFERAYESDYAGLYVVIASWCNQPQFFKKMTFRQFAIARGMSNELYKIYKDNPEKYVEDGHKKGSSWRYMEEFAEKYPTIANKYFDTAGDMLLEYGNGKRIEKE